MWAIWLTLALKMVSPDSLVGTYHGEYRQLDLTHMPSGQNSKYLLILVDTFPEWIGAFLYEIESHR